MMSLEFFFENNPSGRAMVMGSIQSLKEMSTSNIFWVGKGGRCVKLTHLSPSCADIHEIWKPQHPGTLYRPVQAWRGIGSPISWNKLNIVNFVCCPVLSNQRKEHFLCLKVPRLRLFVLLIGVLRWIWVWSIGGMILTHILLTWRIGWAPNNARRWQMGFNSASKWLKKYNH